MAKRYTLNVSREVHLALAEIQMQELRRTGAMPTHDEVLRKKLKLLQPPAEKEKGA